MTTQPTTASHGRPPTPALYDHVFNGFGVPVLSWDLWAIDFNWSFHVFWNWRFARPTDLLDVASDFTRLSLLASLLKLVVALANLSIGQIVSVAFKAHGEFGKNVQLGKDAQAATSYITIEAAARSGDVNLVRDLIEIGNDLDGQDKVRWHSERESHDSAKDFTSFFKFKNYILIVKLDVRTPPSTLFTL